MRAKAVFIRDLREFLERGPTEGAGSLADVCGALEPAIVDLKNFLLADFALRGKNVG
jgi:hypothetical protein